MVKKLIVRVKTGEETNKATKPSKMFRSYDTTILGRNAIDRV